MSTRATAAAGEYIHYVHRIAILLHEKLQEQLVSVVLFGSAARGEAGSESDVDLLIVATEYAPFASRFDPFTAIDEALRASRAYQDLISKCLGTTISPIPLTVEEVDRNPPILLDLVTDGLIIYDRGVHGTQIASSEQETTGTRCAAGSYRRWRLVLGLETGL